MSELGDDLQAQRRSARQGMVIVAGVVVVVIAITLLMVYSLPPRALAAMPSWIPHPGRTLGLNELGGARLVLEVDASIADANALDDLADNVRSVLRDQHVPFDDLRVEGGFVRVHVLDRSRSQAAEAAIRGLKLRDAPEVRLTRSASPDGGTVLAITALPDPAHAMAQTIAVVGRRAAYLGAHAPRVVQIAPNRILVEAPGEDDLDRARIVARTGRLTFQLVDLQESFEDARAGRIPAEDELLPGGSDTPPMVVSKHALIRGDMVTDARMEFDLQNQPAVGFRLDAEGARRFAEATTDHIGSLFAIVLDGRVISAPRINGPISGGRGIITGNFTAETAEELALVLKSGALPVSLRVVQIEHVAPKH